MRLQRDNQEVPRAPLMNDSCRDLRSSAERSDVQDGIDKESPDKR